MKTKMFYKSINNKYEATYTWLTYDTKTKIYNDGVCTAYYFRIESDEIPIQTTRKKDITLLQERLILEGFRLPNLPSNL